MSKTMTGKTITVVPGDQTGPEITAAVTRVLTALGLGLSYDVHEATGGEVPAALLESARQTGAVLMAFQRGRRDEGILPPIVHLREKLGIYANVRPLHNLPNVAARHSGVDLVVVRETAEGVYRHLEHETIPGVYESVAVTTAEQCNNIARFAFSYARRHGRKRVTVVHKSNILKKSDGLFLKTGLTVSRDYPEIEVDECIVDALCMKLVLDPSRFDVLLCNNLFGDIVSDIAAGLTGGPSNCPSLNFGPDGLGVFAAPHGDPADAVGTGRANPLALLLPSVSLLRHIGHDDGADQLMAAINTTLESEMLPIALGGEASCDGFADAVIGRL